MLRIAKLSDHVFELRGSYGEQMRTLCQIGEEAVSRNHASKWCLYGIFEGGVMLFRGNSSNIPEGLDDFDCSSFWEDRGEVQIEMSGLYEDIFGCPFGEKFISIVESKGWLGAAFILGSPSGGGRVGGDFVLTMKPTNSTAKYDIFGKAHLLED